jgi:hypothetical protein
MCVDGCGSAWREQEDSLFERMHRRDQLRKVYQRTLQMAMKGVDEFWREYNEFEKAEDQQKVVRVCTCMSVSLSCASVPVCLFAAAPPAGPSRANAFTSASACQPTSV